MSKLAQKSVSNYYRIKQAGHRSEYWGNLMSTQPISVAGQVAASSLGIPPIVPTITSMAPSLTGSILGSKAYTPKQLESVDKNYWKDFIPGVGAYRYARREKLYDKMLKNMAGLDEKSKKQKTAGFKSEAFGGLFNPLSILSTIPGQMVGYAVGPYKNKKDMGEVSESSWGNMLIPGMAGYHAARRRRTKEKVLKHLGILENVTADKIEEAKTKELSDKQKATVKFLYQ